MKIYTVVVIDRHSDPSIYPYESKRVAITNAKSLAGQYCRFPEDYGENELFNRIDKAIFRIIYSCENDSVTVYEHDLREGKMGISELKTKMPRYRCHKCVSAAKITTLLTHVDGVLDLEMVGPEGEIYKARMTADWNHNHMPDKGGYLVLYDDGYVSYSPADPFEEGYTLLTENEGSEL